MNINLEHYVTKEIPKINLQKAMKYSPYGDRYFLWNKETYYPKYFNLNELIGEEIADFLSLRTVHFELFRDVNNEVWIASKNFIKPNFKYYRHSNLLLIDLGRKGLNIINTYCLNKENYNNILNNIFKMFALDVYMGQNDRCSLNLQLEENKNGYLDLAPLYDYSDACWDDSIVYDNFINYFTDIEDYNEFFLTYPNSINFFKKVKKFDLMKSIINIQERNGFLLPNDIIEKYKVREELSQNKLEKILK